MGVISYWDGEEELDATVSYWNGEDELPGESYDMPFGYPNVQAMIDSYSEGNPFFISHRGGSSHWPEMSMRAYTESVLRGIGALEVSLARTSDGVWFGLHDETLNRTSQIAGADVYPTSLTWDQIQDYNNYFSGQIAPYVRFEEIVEAYGDSHVMFVDPKFRWSDRQGEFLDMVDNLLGPERAVIKGFCEFVGLGEAAQLRGYETWGHYWEASAELIPSTKHAWTMIGFQIDAADAVWEEWVEPVMEERIVIGHIASGNTMINRAISKGCKGVMLANVKAKFPDLW